MAAPNGRAARDAALLRLPPVGPAADRAHTRHGQRHRGAEPRHATEPVTSTASVSALPAARPRRHGRRRRRRRRGDAALRGRRDHVRRRGSADGLCAVGVCRRRQPVRRRRDGHNGRHASSAAGAGARHAGHRRGLPRPRDDAHARRPPPHSRRRRNPRRASRVARRCSLRGLPERAERQQLRRSRRGGGRSRNDRRV